MRVFCTCGAELEIIRREPWEVEPCLDCLADARREERHQCAQSNPVAFFNRAVESADQQLSHVPGADRLPPRDLYGLLETIMPASPLLGYLREACMAAGYGDPHD